MRAAKCRFLAGPSGLGGTHLMIWKQILSSALWGHPSSATLLFWTSALYFALKGKKSTCQCPGKGGVSEVSFHLYIKINTIHTYRLIYISVYICVCVCMPFHANFSQAVWNGFGRWHTHPEQVGIESWTAFLCTSAQAHNSLRELWWWFTQPCYFLSVNIMNI